MPKRRLLLIASLTLTVAVILGVLAILPPRSGVTKANFDRIEKGMTKAEVERILGREGKEVPIGYFMSTEMSTEEFEEVGGASEPILFPPQRKTALLTWVADDKTSGFGRIQFVDDCVRGRYWSGCSETMLDKIRRWLHLD